MEQQNIILSTAERWNDKKISHQYVTVKSNNPVFEKNLTLMLDQEIMDDLPHDIKPVSACFMDQYPDTTLKGTIQIVADQEFDFGKFY